MNASGATSEIVDQFSPLAEELAARLPSGWELKNLGALCEKPQYGWTTKANKEGRGVKFLRTTDITPGFVEWPTVPHCAEEPNDLEKYLIRDGDLLISRAGSIGVSHLVSNPEPAVFASYLIRFRPKVGISAKYLRYYLQSPMYWRAIGIGKLGIAVQNVNATTLSQIPVPVAPEPVQVEIVAEIEKQLSRLDEAVASLKQLGLKAESYRNSVLARVCGDESLRQPLGSLLREPLRNGRSAKAVPDGNGLPTFTLSAVTDGDFSDKNVKQTIANPDRVRDLWVKSGDIFVERSNTPELVGTARLYRGKDDRAIFPDLLIRVRVAAAVLPEWVELCLLSPPLRRYFKSRAQGIAGSMPKIDQDVVNEALIPVPSVAMQKDLVAEAERCFSVIANLEAQVLTGLARAVRLRHSILARAFYEELGGSNV